VANFSRAGQAVIRHMQKFPGPVQADAIILHNISLNQGVPKGVQSGENMAERQTAQRGA
jgi:hypothetical protein